METYITNISRRTVLTTLAMSFLIAGVFLFATPVMATSDPSSGSDGCGNPPSPCSVCPCPPEGSAGHGSDGPKASAGPIQFMLNSTVERTTDLSYSTPGTSWSHVRTYDSRTARATSFREGVRWHGGAQLQYLAVETHGQNNGKLALYLNSTNKRIIEELNGVYSAPKNSPLKVLKNSGGSRETFRITNMETGDVSTYYGLNTNIAAKNRGRLLERYKRSKPGTTTRYYYNSAGVVDWVMTSHGTLIDYEYYTSEDRLKSISVYAGQTTSSDLLQRAEYMYFENATDASGNPITSSKTHLGLEGDLIQVKILKRASSDVGNDPEDLSITRTTQYRYHTNSGNRHQLKMVLESDAIQRLIDYDDNDSINAPEDLLTLGDSATIDSTPNPDLKFNRFASRSFTYYTTGSIPTQTSWGTESGADSLANKYGGGSLRFQTDTDTWDGATKSETFGGGCSSCGGGVEIGVSKEYYYLQLADWYYGIGATEPNRVVRIVIEDTVDGSGNPRSRKLYGVNHKGIALREAFIEDPLDLANSKIWCTSKVLNDDWQTTEERMPSAHAGKTGTNALLKQFLNPTNNTANLGINDSATVHSNSGIVYYYEYDDTHSAGNTTGKRRTEVRIRKGSGTNNRYLISATKYGDGDGDTAGQDHVEGKLPTVRYTYPVQTDTLGDTSRITTSLSYTFWDDTSTGDTAIKTVTTTLPAIANGTNGQNGSGVETTNKQYLDQLGRLRWTVDGEGYINYYSYHPTTGTLAYKITDADPSSLPASANNSGNDTKWITSSHLNAANQPTRDGTLSAPLNIITAYEFDTSGRRILTFNNVDSTDSTGTSGTRHAILYEANETIRFPYLNASGVPTLSAQVMKRNNAGIRLETFSVKPSAISTSNNLPTGYTSGTSNYTSWTRYFYDEIKGQPVKTLRYHDIPGSGDGTHLTNYYVTAFDYDNMGRRTTTVKTVQDTAGHEDQITQVTYDLRQRVVETSRDSGDSGVDTGANSNLGTLTLGGLTKVAESVYDNGGIGDGFKTQTKRYYSATNYIETNYQRTWRGHLRGKLRNNTGTAFGPYTVSDIDWLGRTTATATYATAPTTWPTDYIAYASNTGANSGHNNLTVTHYDDLGRVYQTLRYPGTQSTKHFEINNYYDRNNQLVATGDKHAAHTEYAYDGAGRRYQNRVVKDISATSPYTSGKFDYVNPQPAPNYGTGNESAMLDDSSVGGSEGLIELTHTLFDAAGNAVEMHTLEGNHNKSNGVDLSDTASYVRHSNYSWYDDANRVRTMAQHGSGDGTGSGTGTWTYVALPTNLTEPTSSSDAVLVSKYGYHADTGRKNATTDPMGIVTKTFRNDSGQRTFAVENWQSEYGYDPNAGLGYVPGQNRTTKWDYNGLGQVTELTAYNDSGSATGAQVTQYLYEDDYNASLATNTIYPDSSDTDAAGTDQVKVAYHLDGSINTRTDQRGVVMTYSYDDARRMELQAATTLPTGGTPSIDSTVQAIGRTYDSLGRVETITSYAGTNSSSTPLNQIKHTYNSVGKLSKSEQNHDDEVAVSGDPNVKYYYDTDDVSDAYSDGLRLSTVHHPVVGSYARVEYFYGTSYNDRLHRPFYQKLWDGNLKAGSKAHTVAYYYNGTNRIVRKWSESGTYGLDTSLSYYGSPGNYTGWDRFGRVVKQEWKKSGTTIDRTDYTYDYAGNRTSRNAITSTNDSRDQLYDYDNLHRLKNVEQGTLSSGSITSKSFEQDWTLDQLGNWSSFDQDDDGNGILELAQTRTHNDANELQNASSWPTPAHDAAGNMSTMPRPNNLLSSYLVKYDAWNRMVEVKDTSTVVQANTYDGLHRRIIRTEGTTAKHFYYNNKWQVLTEADGSGNATAIYSYNPGYIDSVAVRMTPTDEHLYLHDALFNVTAVVDEASSAVTERYSYTPYGKATVLDADYSADAGNQSDIGNEYLYTGRRLDSETGLQLNRHRYYHSALGRWVNRDPIGYRGRSLNLYQYVGSDPTGWVDPLGLEDRKEWPDEKSKKDALSKALCNDPKSPCEFAKEFDPTWGTNGGLLLNLEYDTPGYGNVDVDWMLTLLNAHCGNAPGLPGWLLEGLDPGTIYDIGKPIWIIQDGIEDPNVDIDFDRFGQDNELAAIRAARDLINGDTTLEDLFGFDEKDCECSGNNGGPGAGNSPGGDRNSDRRRNDRGRRDRRNRGTGR